MGEQERKALNERLAVLFGWEKYADEDFPATIFYWYDKANPGLTSQEPPDFCAIDGPWIGRMLQALTDGCWHLYPPIQGIFSYYKWEYGSLVKADDDLGIATGLAFVALRAGTAGEGRGDD